MRAKPGRHRTKDLRPVKLLQQLVSVIGKHANADLAGCMRAKHGRNPLYALPGPPDRILPACNQKYGNRISYCCEIAMGINLNKTPDHVAEECTAGYKPAGRIGDVFIDL